MLTRAKLGLAPGDIALLSVGDLNENKNRGVLAEALALLPVNYKFFIAGEGPLHGALEQKARRLGAADRVKLLGFCKDVAALPNACDLFCFPSKREGLPVSLIEAMACSAPCLASGARGCADALGDLSDTCIVYGGPNEWARRIKQTVNNPDLFIDVVDASKFDVQSIVKQMERIYA